MRFIWSSYEVNIDTGGLSTACLSRILLLRRLTMNDVFVYVYCIRLFWRSDELTSVKRAD